MDDGRRAALDHVAAATHLAMQNKRRVKTFIASGLAKHDVRQRRSYNIASGYLGNPRRENFESIET
jgi:hypothetical protein